MALGTVTFRANQTGLHRLLEDRNGPVTLAIANFGREVRGKVKRCVPKVSHNLERSVRMRMVRQARGWTAEVYSDEPYASWIETGKRHDPRSGRTIFVKVGPRPCFRNALRDSGITRSRRIIV